MKLCDFGFLSYRGLWGWREAMFWYYIVVNLFIKGINVCFSMDMILCRSFCVGIILVCTW